MPEQNPNSADAPSRRKFLRTLAILGGGVAVPAGFSSIANALTPGSAARLRIGVAFPAFGNEGAQTATLINGLRLALLSAPGIHLDVLSEGTVRSRIKTLSATGVDLIIGAVTPRVAFEVGHQLKDSNAVFLNVEPGAHLQRSKDVQPNVFHHTLQLWQAHYAAGVAAVSRGSRAAILSSYHESGYDSTSAFIAGFESAGGQVIAQAVSHVPGRDVSLSQTVSELRQGNPDFIYVNASGARAAELTQAVGADALAAPFAQTGGVTEPRFVRSYQQATGRDADAYALLGYEAGQLVLAATHQMTEGSLTLRSALSTAAFTGPRGSIQMQAATQTTSASAYVSASGGVLTQLAAVTEHEARAHAGWKDAVSGWSLPYAASTNTHRA
jgi:branched-chain amino acid transport system substrate-binding protein